MDCQARARAMRRERERAGGPQLNIAQKQQLIIRQKGRCHYCKTGLTNCQIHYDHKTPLFRGGDNGPDNICAACKDCNLRKGRWLTEAEFKRWLRDCAAAPDGYWVCRHPKHKKYVGTRFVPIAQFNKGDSWCKQCRASYGRQYWTLHGERINAERRDRYDNDPQYREAEKARAREAHANNATSINAARRARYDTDPKYHAQALARAQAGQERRKAAKLTPVGSVLGDAGLLLVFATRRGGTVTSDQRLEQLAQAA